MQAVTGVLFQLFEGGAPGVFFVLLGDGPGQGVVFALLPGFEVAFDVAAENFVQVVLAVEVVFVGQADEVHGGSLVVRVSGCR